MSSLARRYGAVVTETLSENRGYAGLAVAATVLLWTFPTIRYFSFTLENPGDMAVLNQIMYTFTYELVFRTTLHGGKNYLAETHFTPILVLISPLYALAGNILTLFFVTAVSFAVSGVLLGKVAEMRFGNPVYGYAVFILFLFYPASLNLSIVNGFRPVILSVLFLSGAIYAFERDSFRLFVLMLLLAMLCKETIALAVVPFAVVGWLEKRSALWSATPVVLGIGYFYVVTSLVMPGLRGGSGFAGADVGEFSHLGNSAGEIVTTVLLNPLDTISLAVNAQSLIFAFKELFPGLFLSLLAPEVLFIPASQWALVTLADSGYFLKLYNHYHAPLLPFVVWSLLIGIQRVQHLTEYAAARRESLRRIVDRYSAFMGTEHNVSNPVRAGILALVLANVLLFSPFGAQVNHASTNVGWVDNDIHGQLAEVPSDASVSSQHILRPQLSSRGELYRFPDVSGADYIVLNTQMTPWPLSESEYNSRIQSLKRGSAYTVVTNDSRTGVLIFRRS